MMKAKSRHFILSAALMLLMLTSSLAFASSNTGITYQGRIVNPDGTAFQQSSVQFLIQINGSSTLHGDGTAGADTCLLYRETQTLDMSTSNGAFSLIIGQGSSPQFGSGVSSLVTVFRNPQTNAPTVADAIGAISCTSGQTNFLPSTWDDNRSLTVTVTAGSTVLNLAAVPIQAVPYSHQALQVGGYGSDSLMRVQGSRPGTTNNFSLNQFDFLLNLGINAVTPGNPSTYQATNLLANDPTTAQQVATKHYVDTAVSAATGGTITSVAGTAPIQVTTAGATATVSLSTSGATSGQVLQYNGSAWVPATIVTSVTGSALNSAQIWVGNASNAAAPVSVTGDVSLSNAGVTSVNKLQGAMVSSTAPTSGQVLQYNGSAWVPTTPTTYQSSTLNDAKIWVGNSSNVATGVSVTGDASIIDTGALTVTGLQGKAVSSTAPTSNQVLQYNGSQWVPSTLTLGTVISGGTQNVVAIFNAAGTNVVNSSITDNGATGVDFANSKLTFNGSLFAHNDGTKNTFLGIGSGTTTLTGFSNTGIGYNSLNAANNGNGNSALGTGALSTTTDGNYNTAVGWNSMQFNLTGSSNTAVGRNALNNSTGSNSTALGDSALQVNGTGANNVALGYQSMGSSNGTHYNTAVGAISLSNPGGDYNTAVGYQALNINTNGASNTAVGYNTGTNITSGNANVLLGNGAGPSTSGAYSNKLYINNTASNAPLIGGDFSAGYVQINNMLEVPLSSATPTPTAGYGRVYAKADGNLYFKNGTTEYQLSGVAPGGVTSLAATAPLAVSASTGAITASMNLTSGHVYVGNASNLAADVAMSGDTSISNAGAVTVNKINGTSVAGVGLLNNDLLQNNSGSTLAANSLLVTNGTDTGVTAVPSQNSAVMISSGSGVPSWSASATASGQILQYNGSAWVPTTANYQSNTLNSAQIWVGNASNVAAAVTPSGDVSISNAGATLVNKLQGSAVSSTAPTTAGQALVWNGSSWGPSAAVTDTGTGTANYVTKWSNATGGLANSLIFDNGTNVGIGTSNPGASLDVNGNAAWENNTTTSSGPTFSFWKTRNYTALANNDELGFVSFYGHDGTGLYRSAYIAGHVDAAPASATHTVQGRLEFYTTPSGASDASERMRITSAGNVGIGTTNPMGSFVVAKSGPGVEIWPGSWPGGATGIMAYDRTASAYNGLEFDAATISLAAGGLPTKGVYVASGGNVGIGTTSPGYALHVLTSGSSDNGVKAEASGTAGPELSLKSTDTGGREYLLVSTATANAPGAGYLGVYDNTAGGGASGYRMVINSSGKMGIGTVAPGARLHVYDASSSIETLRLESPNAAGTYMSIWGPSSTLSGFIGSDPSVSGGANSVSDLGIRSAGNTIFHTAGSSERMRITSTGSVGIGTTSPGSTLDVVGNITTRQPSGTNTNLYMNSTSAANVIYFQQAGNSRFTINGSNWSGGTDDFVISNYNNAGTWLGVPFQIQRSTGSIYLVQNGGNVGVGTAGPNYKLDVAGDINTSSCFRIGATTVSGTCTSDARLKENIQDYNQGLKELLGIRLRTYQFNGLGEMPKTGETAVGVIAQEVEKTNPDLVKTRKVKMHPEDKDLTDIKVVDYSKFTYMLINAVKDLYHQFMGVQDQQKAQAREIASLKDENQKLNDSDKVKEQKIKALEKENAEMKKRLDRIEKVLDQRTATH